jgi:hypothetical protein
MLPVTIYKTKNIKFCAYLRLMSVHPVKVEKFQRGKAIYVYSLTQQDWDKLKLEFNNSQFLEFANCLEAIKDLAY